MCKNSGRFVGGLLCAALACAGSLRAEDAASKKKVLIFTKSSGFQHPIINRYDKPLSEGEKAMSDIVTGLGFEPVCTKDGSEITADNLKKYTAVIFYTSGDLGTVGKPNKNGKADDGPVVTPEGKAALIDAVKGGLAFVGIHSASDTYHTFPEKDDRYAAAGDKLDPYLKMLGAEFIAHDKHQPGSFTVVDAKFPGNYPGPTVKYEDGEWYSLKDFAPDMHVLTVFETAGMDGDHYKRGPYPLSWIRKYGDGRVFYTALGHGNECWKDPAFITMLTGGVRWATGLVDADLTPNLKEAAPHFADIPAKPSKKKKETAPAATPAPAAAQ